MGRFHQRYVSKRIGIRDKETSTSSLRPSSLSKWQTGRGNRLDQLLKYSKIRRVFCHMTLDGMAFSDRGYFQRLAAMFVFWQIKTVVLRVLRDKVISA